MSSSTARRAARTLAMATAMAALTASAAEAYVPGPGNGKRLITERPDVTGARIITGEVGDGRPNEVRVCFDQPISTIPGQQSFFIHTYDANRFMQASNAIADPDPACAVVRFADSQDIGEGTVFTVDAGAVRDASNRPNVQNSEPLAGSRITPVAGATTGPDLTDVQVNNDNTISFFFDEELDQSAIGDTNPAVENNQGPADIARRFGFIRENGVVVNGANIAAGRAFRNRVDVTFGSTDGALRFFFLGPVGVANADIRDLPQSAGGSTPAPHGVVAGNPTGRPSIISATRASDVEFDLRYNQSVTLGSVGQFFGVTEDARFAEAAGFSKPADPAVIRVRFNENVAADPGGLVRIIDFNGGARSQGGTPSTTSFAVSAAPLARPGYTAGPDLLQATFDRNANQITYRFDEPVRSSGLGVGGFFVMTPTGAATSGSDGPIIDRTERVRVNFPDTIGNTTGGGLNYTAVLDSIGNRGPVGFVSYEIEPFPVDPPPAPPAVQASGTPSPTPVARRTQRFTTSVSLKRTGRSSRRKYSGRVVSGGPGCRSGRRVVFKRVNRRGQGETIRLKDPVFTKGDGTFVLRRKRFTGKVYVFVTERNNKTRAVLCRSGVSKRVRG